MNDVRVEVSLPPLVYHNSFSYFYIRKMETPLINILIRTHNRPGLFDRCIQSVKNQTYKNYNIIVGYDGFEAMLLVSKYRQIIHRAHPVFAEKREDHFWNLFCNDIKELVTEGWFFFLDSDDYLHNQNSLANIAEHLNNPNEGVICQMLRNGRPKPNNNLMDAKIISCGRIGMPCMFLHHSKKNITYFDAMKAADYRWIRDCAAQLPMKFVKVVVVETGNNGLHGK